MAELAGQVATWLQECERTLNYVCDHEPGPEDWQEVAEVEREGWQVGRTPWLWNKTQEEKNSA